MVKPLYDLKKIEKEGRVYKTVVKEIKPCGKNLYELLVTIKRGFRHQIRVHMASNGYPLYGDPLYSPFYTGEEKRMALHALSIKFLHPEKNNTFTILDKSIIL